MMKALKPSLLLFTLVLTIYVMRNGDISVGSTVRRILQEYRPSANLCKGTELSQVYSQSEIDRAKSFKASLQGMRGGNPMMTLLTEKKVQDGIVDYLMGALAFIVPWGAMFIISILTAIVITCNWCCIYGCCKNAKCCKCCKEPKDSSKKRIYVFISAIFALAGIGSGIAGIVVSSGVPKGIELTICSVIAVAEDLAYGRAADHWLGVQGALNSIDDLLAKFDDISGTLTGLGSTSGVITAAQGVKNQLNTMYNNLQGTPAIARPDPSSTDTYTPTYIANVGPETDTATMTGLVAEEVKIMNATIETAQQGINVAVSAINDPALKATIQGARNDVNSQASTIQDALKSVNDFGEIGKTAITGIGAALTAIFAATLTFSIFAVGAMLMVGLCKMKSFNKFLHSSWMGFTLMSILGFLLSTVLYPLSLVLMETCDVVQQALSSSTIMNKLTGNILDGNSAGDIVNICIYGDGDIITYLKVDDTLSSFKEINDQFASIEAVMPLVSAAPPSLTLAYQDWLVASLKSGKMGDAPESIADLVVLNRAVNHQNNSCTNIYDTWAFNSVNCTSDKGAFFNTSNVDTYDLPNPTCIGFDIWGTRDPISRYGPPQNSFASCGTVGAMTTQSYVETFINKFKSNRISVANIFTNVRNELDDVQEKYDYFAGNITTILTGIVNIKNELTTVEASLYDNSTGLFRNMKCTFIKTSLERFTDAMCVGFIGSLYQTSVVIIICSVMSFFGAIFVFCLAKRFVLQDPNTKPKPV